ncbi:hypothetical protein PR202_gb18085 [Eleusine coracana subsp. coracana]|uniref:PIR2-like helical domain-containing protein n=1 Tax=Eleusine coracana subsp. coracana TaxID=191504 RepID=A0AAV5F2E6_ELECO|nr:hypothetical protein PR202_gb18018 [Eleusine coracana subsp. coracana]GJN29829.1 hypothetical protein PR202_gb18085 [Eleusine coracana subsp. coracana]
MKSSFRFRDTVLGDSILGGSRQGSGSINRIYGPRDLEDTFLIEVVEDAFKPVLAKIEKIHGDVNIAAYRNGFCFGLLDPISNIVINSAISATISASEPLDYRPDEGQAAVMAMRSLNGLVAFLTYLFPYLPNEEAMGYLDAADADLVVACLLIIRRRGMQEFDPCSSTAVAAFETALRFAAIAAQHPDPEQFVQRWKQISYDGLHRFCYKPHSKLQNMIVNILGMLGGAGSTSNDGISVKISWLFAKDRLINKLVKELPPARAAMKRMLLATIHGFYLQALAKLPTDELRCRYHRSMLMGGYCYGPLDPVSNILLNTMWYDRRFPSTKECTLQMVSTECLWRITAQSLYGLVSFLCTRYPALTPDLAMQRLLVARADLLAADPNLPKIRTHNVPVLNWSGCGQVGARITGGRAKELQDKAVDSCAPSASVEEAYAAAATAAFHPNPSAQQKILGSQSAMTVIFGQLLTLKEDTVPSTYDIFILSESLFTGISLRELDEQAKPVPRNKEHVRCTYCERQGTSIVHPTAKGFQGREKEFEKLLRGEPFFVDGSDMYNNDELITHKQQFVDWVHMVRDDYIYYDDEAAPDGDDEQNKRPYVNFR